MCLIRILWINRNIWHWKHCTSYLVSVHVFWFDSSITCCLIASKGLFSLAPCQALNSFEQEHGDLLSPDVIRPLFYEKISSNVYHISSKVYDNKKQPQKVLTPCPVQSWLLTWIATTGIWTLWEFRVGWIGLILSPSSSLETKDSTQLVNSNNY